MDIKNTTSSQLMNSKLNTLFLIQLQHLYWAEQKQLETLSYLVEIAENSDLKNALRHHLAETQIHVYRLQYIFDVLNEKPVALKWQVMESIIDEGTDMIVFTDKYSDGLDLVVLAACEKINCYEVASYLNLIQFAVACGQNGVLEALEQTLNEERMSNKLLGRITSKESATNHAELLV